MITEQRLRFEATNEVPKGVVYNPNTDWYESVEQSALPELLRDGPGAYNMKYQGFKEGYQSALEDRHGEAVATLVIQEWGTYGHEYSLKLDCMESDDPSSLSKLALKIDLGEHKLFTSPQPAQPGQWNAAIEAAADTAHDAIHNAIYKIDDCEPVKASVVDAILALRKGA